MRGAFTISLALMLVLLEGFRLTALRRFNTAGLSRRESVPSERAIPKERTTYKGTTLSGIISEADDCADSVLITSMHGRKSLGFLNVVVDSVPFARKRLVTPQTIYSGLFDVLKFSEVSRDRITETAWPFEDTLVDSEALLASNVSLSQLAHVVEQVTSAGLKRVVLGVKLAHIPLPDQLNSPLQDLPDIHTAVEALTRANIIYTIVVYQDTLHRPAASTVEAVPVPYRICGGVNPLHSLNKAVDIDPELGPERILPSLQDLHRILSEVVDMTKSHNKVYGLRAGGLLDQQMLSLLRTQGCSEREQVALLLGDIMSHVDEHALEEAANADSEDDSEFDEEEEEEDSSSSDHDWT